jgi:hypothetical protein
VDGILNKMGDMEQVIDREDMLELTRRLTSKRTNLVRIAGAYMDDEGYIDGTFNTSFLSLKGAEKERCLAIAKEVLFSDTNRELKSHRIPGMLPGSIWQLLYAIGDCELKNDALLLNLYEIIAGQYPKGREYAIYIYYGVYDVPVKASDKERLEDSEEVYSYIIAAIAPTDADQVPEMPNAGFLYPAFTNRSTDMEHINVFRRKR